MKREVVVMVPCFSGIYGEHKLRVHAFDGRHLEVVRVFLIRGPRQRELRIGAMSTRLWYELNERTVEALVERYVVA